MTSLLRLSIAAALTAAASLTAGAQAMFFNSAQMDTPAESPEGETVSVSDSLLSVYALDSDDLFNMPPTLPDAFFMPTIYDTYHYITPLKVGEQVHSGEPWKAWLEDAEVMHRQVGALNQYLFFSRPDVVKYNMSMLPAAPPQYQVVMDPSDFSITVVENFVEPAAPTIEPEEVKKRHWIRAFSTNLQFSQAYVSPNWYQGGNNALNVLGHIVYNVKLNTAFHPNLMFENNFQYKVGLNNAPDDSIHAYNITEDLLQFNSTFGLKAAKRWYYSITGQFKTQVLHSYKSNTHDLLSSFLSPAELTAGVGMTYSYKNQAETFTFNASLAPLSYQLYVCLSDKLNRSAYGIAEGHRTVSKFGSTAEFVLGWKISHNIAYNTRLFAFTDYESFRADWENTLSFEINRFLTTQIYAHLRYDTRTPYVDANGKWKKLQLKEIFSIGFAYKFSTI